jgi:DNA-binding SARP family transcriptional activator
MLEARFVLNLLGGFELWDADQAVRMTPAVQRLVAFVATRTARVSRAAVAQALWPDAPEARAAANLRSTLWRLHRGDGGQGPISSTDYGLEVSPETTVDIRAVQAMAAGMWKEAAGGPVGVDPAALSDDLLPEWDEEWLVTTREWFRQVRLHALEALCVRHCREGRFAAALEAGLAAVACEPLRESAHREVVRAHLAEGNQAEAVRQYRSYCRLLNDELGLSPSARFQTLMASLGVGADTVR